MFVQYWSLIKRKRINTYSTEIELLTIEKHFEIIATSLKYIVISELYKTPVILAWTMYIQLYNFDFILLLLINRKDEMLFY